VAKKTKKSKMMRSARKAPEWVRHVAATKAKPFKRSVGKLGAASSVRVIMKDGVLLDPGATETG
jgi:phage terminase small subunit